MNKSLQAGLRDFEQASSILKNHLTALKATAEDSCAETVQYAQALDSAHLTMLKLIQEHDIIYITTLLFTMTAMHLEALVFAIMQAEQNASAN